MSKINPYKILSVLGLFALAVSACDNTSNAKKTNGGDSQNAVHYDTTKENAPEAPKKVISKAYAIITPKSDSDLVGSVTFKQVEEGVLIIADIGGLTPGKHGFHVHEHGDCSAHDGSSAGGHFNPTNKKHGGPNSLERHVGDLGNLEANQAGLAHYNRIDKVISLNGDQSIIGKSIVIHAGEDDLTTDPSGNSGARIGCGEIKAFD